MRYTHAAVFYELVHSISPRLNIPGTVERYALLAWHREPNGYADPSSFNHFPHLTWRSVDRARIVTFRSFAICLYARRSSSLISSASA